MGTTPNHRRRLTPNLSASLNRESPVPWTKSCPAAEEVSRLRNPRGSTFPHPSQTFSSCDTFGSLHLIITLVEFIPDQQLFFLRRHRKLGAKLFHRLYSVLLPKSQSCLSAVQRPDYKERRLVVYHLLASEKQFASILSIA